MADNRGREALWAQIDDALNAAGANANYTAIAAQLRTSRSTVSRRAARLQQPHHKVRVAEDADDMTVDPTNPAEVGGTLALEDIGRIHTLPDLLAFFRVDTARWEVDRFKVNKWESPSKTPEGDVRVTPLYQVKASLVRARAHVEAEFRRMLDEVLVDIAAHAPPPAPEPVSFRKHLDGQGVLAVVNIYDPHIGMLAYDREVGHNYDTDIATRDYRTAVDTLLSFAALYPLEKILYVVGNDLMHVDTSGQNASGGTTTAGTAQDIDSRLERIRTATRRALVYGLDRARTLAPVDAACVPGNHDRASTYWMGEVLNAWYNNDEQVNVQYSPAKRSFYGFGNTTLMLTHGEEYRRKRDNLPMIFADECPPEMWVASAEGARDILTGHNHVKLRGGYYPTGEMTESRGIRTRSLPGLTPEDAWHTESGYHHRRAATLLVYGRDGTTLGEHEFTL